MQKGHLPMYRQIQYEYTNAYQEREDALCSRIREILTEVFTCIWLIKVYLKSLHYIYEGICSCIKDMKCNTRSHILGQP